MEGYNICHVRFQIYRIRIDDDVCGGAGEGGEGGRGSVAGKGRDGSGPVISGEDPSLAPHS